MGWNLTAVCFHYSIIDWGRWKLERWWKDRAALRLVQSVWFALRTRMRSSFRSVIGACLQFTAGGFLAGLPLVPRCAVALLMLVRPRFLFQLLPLVNCAAEICKKSAACLAGLQFITVGGISSLYAFNLGTWLNNVSTSQKPQVGALHHDPQASIMALFATSYSVRQLRCSCMANPLCDTFVISAMPVTEV
jgi:hypothetical protein